MRKKMLVQPCWKQINQLNPRQLFAWHSFYFGGLGLTPKNVSDPPNSPTVRPIYQLSILLQSLQLITGLTRTCDYNFLNRLIKEHMLTLWEWTTEKLLCRGFFLSCGLIMRTMESLLALCLVPYLLKGIKQRYKTLNRPTKPKMRKMTQAQKNLFFGLLKHIGTTQRNKTSWINVKN